MLFVFVLDVQAQKENNVWVGGTKSAIDFNSGAAVPFLRDSTLTVNRSNASICDKDGNLLFYTNGYRVYNKNYQLMQNGNGLEIGDYEDWGYGYNSLPDGIVIVPMPGDTNRYYIFHGDVNYVTFGPSPFVDVLLPTRIFCSVVDMSLAGGLGGIVSGQKNVVLFSDTLTSCGIKAVKHGNGRDYWLLMHELESNRYYRFLIDPYGIHGPYEQNIGPELNGYNALGFSTLHFNEETTTAAQLVTEATSIVLYDFDRCTGEFFNQRQFQVSDTLYYTLGAAFSPSGQYLYATGNFHLLWQFDATAFDVFASRKLVAQYNGLMNPFPTDFYQLRLAPDNKIYIHSYDFNFSLHVIHEPDSAGAACDFEANGLTINPPGWSWRGFPNIVKYWLPAVSGCDTLTSTKPLSIPTFTFSVYPNPFANEFQISATGVASEVNLEVTNVMGQRVHQAVLHPVNNRVHASVDLSASAAGVYVVRFAADGRQHQCKIVKQ